VPPWGDGGEIEEAGAVTDPRKVDPTGDQELVAWATELLRVHEADFDRVVEAGLHRVSRGIGSAGAVVFSYDHTAGYAEATYEWRIPGVPSVLGGRYLRSEVADTFAALESGAPVVLLANEPPTDFRGLRAVMADQGSTGAMLFPIHDGQEMTWILVFEWRDEIPSFERAQIDFGTRAASLLHAGLDRRRELRSQAETQSKMLERQKLETLGVMAGGIVHDFNNVLQTVLGTSEVLVDQLPEGDLRDMASLMGRAADHAADLTRRFLVFSRQDVRERQNISVADSLNATLKLLRRSIPEDRRLRLTTDPSAGKVYMPPVDFEQAIVNLCNNASAAMPDGGTISIDCRAAPDASDSVQITVQDDGRGMRPEELARAFDLFYTTKPPGEGTGLGLPMARRAVEQAGGSLHLESVPGEGTTVSIRLPKTTVPDSSRREDEGPPIQGNETILLVEDDSFVRRVARTHLQKAGFSVIEAPDGQRGLELYRQHRGEVALILTDVIMPGLGGVALWRAIAAEGPAPPFLFASAYDAGALDAAFLEGEGRDFVSKPYQAKQMLRRVRRLIDARKAAVSQRASQ